MKKLLLCLLILQSTLASSHEENCEIEKAQKLFDTNFTLTKNQNLNLNLATQDPKSDKIFRDINQKVYLLYSNQIKKHGAKLSIKEIWGSEELNAYAQKYEDKWTISMHGGLYRHPYLSNDAYALVVCHEMGHLLGGAPYTYSKEKTSIEGQADLWGIGSCLPRYFKAFSFNDDIEMSDKRVLKICNSQNIDLKICYRSVLAAESLTRTLAQASGQMLPSISLKDKSIVNSTSITHPPSQCRLDTFLNGVMCDVSDELDTLATLKESTIATTPLKCKTDFLSREANVRPSCWFNEKAHNIETSLELYDNSTGKITIKYMGHTSGTFRVTVNDVSQKLEFYSRKYNEETLLFSNTQNWVAYTFKMPSRRFRDTVLIKIFKDNMLIYAENMSIN